jgi:hypothetical protein
MLEDIKFDLQTLDYRALRQADWAELKGRLEGRARTDRDQAARAAIGFGCTETRRIAPVASARTELYEFLSGIMRRTV